MKAASDGPTKLRSVNSKCRFPGTRARRCRDCLPAARAPHHLVAVLHAADPDAAVGALQLQNRERLRGADVPHLERSAAMGAGQWLSVRSVLSGASRHVPLAPGCLPGLRPDGGGSFAPGGVAPSLGPPSLRPT